MTPAQKFELVLSTEKIRDYAPEVADGFDAMLDLIESLNFNMGDFVSDITIREVVADLVDNNKLFTAYDVSKAVQAKGIRRSHTAMRDDVHKVIAELGAGKYSRTLLDVAQGAQAWVYHPVNESPYQYVTLPGTTPAAIAVVSPPITAATPAGIPDGTYGTDARGRLCIPVKFVSDIAVNPGKQVMVVADNNRLTIQRRPIDPTGGSDPFDLNDKVTVYTAETDGNVRITQATLAKAGIGGMPYYKITLDSDAGEIVVTG